MLSYWNDNLSYDHANGCVGKEVITMLAFQHYLHPLHVYCRLVDVGVSKSFSKKLCQLYESLWRKIRKLDK